MEDKNILKAEESIHKEEKSIERRVSDVERKIGTLQILSIVVVVLLVASILYTLMSTSSAKHISYATTTISTQVINKTNSTFGQTTANIDAPLSNIELAAINNAPNSNFEQAGEMVFNTSQGNAFGETYNNGEYTGTIFIAKPPAITPYIVNGKPSVIYLGAISCIFCAENRWAMALALSRFGKFNELFTGYSSFGDGDVPTLYWNADNYTAVGVTFGNKYVSNYINFISADYDSPITSGFEFPQSGVSYFVNAAPNSTYKGAYQLINSSSLFAGTPFSIWGSSVQNGADAVVFGTAQPGQSTSLPPMSYMTHAQILAQIASFNTTFAKEEYAAADVYIAELCPSINNAAPVCSLPAIQKMEGVMGFSINATK